MGDGAGPSAGPSNAPGLSRRDVNSWLKVCASAFREAGGVNALKQTAEEARLEERRRMEQRINQRYNTKVQRYLADLNEGPMRADDDCISTSSWEKEDGYQNALRAWKDANARRIPGHGYKAVARRFSCIRWSFE